MCCRLRLWKGIWLCLWKAWQRYKINVLSHVCSFSSTSTFMFCGNLRGCMIQLVFEVELPLDRFSLHVYSSSLLEQRWAWQRFDQESWGLRTMQSLLAFHNCLEINKYIKYCKLLKSTQWINRHGSSAFSMRITSLNQQSGGPMSYRNICKLQATWDPPFF